MKRWHYYLLYGSTISLLIIAATMIASSSLWFLRGMLGNTQGVIEFGYEPSAMHGSNQKVMDQSMPVALTSLGISLSHYYRFIYIQDRSEEYIACIPTITNQLHAGSEMRKNGWKVHRFAWMLYGEKPVHGSVNYITGNSIQRNDSIVTGIQEVFASIFIRRLPVNPVAIVRVIPGFFGFENGLSAYITQNNDGMHAALRYDGGIVQGSSRKASSVLPDKKSMYVAIQSDILKNVSPQFLAAFNGLASKNLSFTKTNPDIISTIPDNNSVHFLQEDSNWAIGVIGKTNTFQNNILRYMKDEQGARHPVKRGFKLPDGTIGHEYIASSPVINFLNIDASSQCKKSTGYDEQFFMCENSDKVVISRDQQSAEKLLAKMSATSEVAKGSVPSSILQLIIPAANGSSASFVADTHTADIWLNHD
ncbi:MAG TPA: hypothetical protein VLG69_00280 [Candidatus Andersenbacteria bacterium]|nr:hypothetical protein [Candidatus Andersenbacteria bacterium]